MDQKLINELAIIIGKINYVYKGVRKTKKTNYDVEIELLRQYSVELYDGLIKIKNSGKPAAAIVEMPTLEESASQLNGQEPVIAVVEEKSILDSVIEVVSDAKESTKDFFGEAKGALEGVAEAIEEKVEDIVETVEDKVEGVIETVKETTEDLDDIDDISEDLEEVTVEITEEDITAQTEVHPDLRGMGKEEMTDDEAVATQVITNLPTQEEVTLSEEETVAINVKEVNETLKTAQIDLKQPVSVVEEVATKDVFQISGEQKAAFIKELFNNNAKLYAKSINDLGESQGYIEALTYINLNLRYDLNWDDESPVVKDFLQTIKSKFLGNY